MLALPNLVSLIFLLMALFFAKKKMYRAHASMISICMLASFYLVYLFIDIRVRGAEGMVSKEYMATASLAFKILLGTHIVAAVITLPLSLVTVTMGAVSKLRPRYHVKLARILVPIWLYNSVTGLLMYIIVK